jgi:hypothetical protein
MKNDSIIISGTIAGTVEHYTALIPRSILDHNQVNKSYFKSNYHIFIKIYKEQGILGFFRGSIPLFGSVSLAHVWLFYFYELNKETSSTTNSIIYSSIAKIGHDILMIPGDTIRMRNNISGMNNIQTIKDIYKNQKLLGFFKGSPISIIMNVPGGITEFFILKSCIKHFGDETYKIFGYGAFAGITTSIINNPLDIIKTRIQTQGLTNMHSQVKYPFYKSYLDIFKTTYEERGIRGLFRGSLLRSFQGAIGYGTYEYVSSRLNKLNNKY